MLLIMISTISYYQSRQFLKLLHHASNRGACGKPGTLKASRAAAVAKALKPPVDPKDSSKFCIEKVKKYDRENYLSALCITSPVLRRVVFALRAFNVELAIVKDTTTSPDSAKVRFHFWSKLIEEIVRQNKLPEPNIEKSLAYYNHTPIAKELLDLFYLVDLDEDMKRHLDDLIGARVSSKAMGSKLFSTMDELELYCSKSNGSLYHLCWKLCHQMKTLWHQDYDIIPTVGAISDALGVAHGLSNIIRGIPYNGYMECCYIPADLMERHQLRTRDFVGRQIKGETIAPAVQDLATRCQEELDVVNKNQNAIPEHLKHLFLPRVAIQANLKRLKKCNYNICDPKMNSRNELLPLSLWLASRFSWAPVL